MRSSLGGMAVSGQARPAPDVAWELFVLPGVLFFFFFEKRHCAHTQGLPRQTKYTNGQSTQAAGDGQYYYASG
jgi:hypothetical protein